LKCDRNKCILIVFKKVRKLKVTKKRRGSGQNVEVVETLKFWSVFGKHWEEE